jgi:hypothetical protein
MKTLNISALIALKAITQEELERGMIEKELSMMDKTSMQTKVLLLVRASLIQTAV